MKQSVWLQGNFSLQTARQGTLNFHPVLAMDGNNTPVRLPRNIEALQTVTIFTVYQSPGTDEESPVWEMKGNFGDLLLSNNQVSSKSGNTSLVFAKDKQESSGAIIHTYTSYKAAALASENTEYKEASIRFGNPGSAGPANSFQRLISEFILYERILNEEEITKVETYLALKYGITLGKNYLNALGKTVWNRKNDESYSNNIAGIGRDDQSSLYQKQGTSCNTPGQLVIGIDKIVQSNSKNMGQINDKDYLIWGDNAQNSMLKQNEEVGPGEIMLSEKKWLMKPSGSTANMISTEVKIDTKTLVPGSCPKGSFYLIIDRSGTGDFLPQHCIYITPDVISPEGIASFNHVNWDTDGSGKDVFTFGFKALLPASLVKNNKDAAGNISFQVYPNPVTNGHYTIAIKLDKPSDVQIQIYDLNQHLIDSKKGKGQASYFFSQNINAPAASYIVRVTTPETEFYRILIVQ